MRIVTFVTLVALSSLAVLACEGGGSSSDPGGTFDTGVHFPGQDIGFATRDTGQVEPDLGGARDLAGGAEAGPPPDVAPCEGCPPERPVCAEGQCACTSESCGAGRWCQGGACVACEHDEHCTPDCLDCTAFGRVCTADGASCIECARGEDCEAGYFCEDGDCLPCNTGARCGLDCVACEAPHSRCVAGQCVCDERSCPVGAWCFNGLCVACDTDARCGADCLDCTRTGTPVCNEGACRCTADLQCGSGHWCDAGACVACALDDPLHCGASCAVCGDATSVCAGGYCVCGVDADCPTGYWCAVQGCLPCDTSARCGESCEACPAERATCHEGACVACVADADCGAAAWCEAGTCRPCADDDPLHCGAACAVCEATTPACYDGACECAGASCGPNFRCLAGNCLRCNEDSFCGADCGACPVARPYCLADGSACVACRQDSHCGAEEVCRDNVCVPDCLAQGCASDTSADRKKCSRPWIVGRTAAAAGQGLEWSGDTTNAGNDDDLPSQWPWQDWASCWDARYDQFYRIYLMAGETLYVRASNLASDFDATLKLYDGTDCDANGFDRVIECTNDGGDGRDEDFTYTATHEGWFTVVIDGRSAGVDEADQGSYRIRFSLTCSRPNCCCY